MFDSTPSEYHRIKSLPPESECAMNIDFDHLNQLLTNDYSTLAFRTLFTDDLGYSTNS